MMPSTSTPMQIVDDEFFADPHAAYRRWHRRGPVHHVDLGEGGRIWVVTGWAEGRAALTDPRLHKSIAGVPEVLRLNDRRALPGDGALSSNMLNSDAPDHTRLRSLVSSAFTPKSIAALRPRIEEITADLLDAMAGRDTADLIEDFAVPLPITVICEMLGVPLADRADFRAWTDTLLTVGTVDERTHAGLAMSEYLADLVAATRDRPADDILTALIHARDDGDRLTEKELVSTSFLLLVAGHETTVNLIGNGALALMRHPETLAALHADPAAIPAAVEEFLRYDGPVDLTTIRYTTEDVEIGGVTVPANQLVYVALTAANRDGDKFESPDVLDVDRATGGHIAFGHGIHYCLGAPLARLEARVAFTGLLSRFPDLHLEDDAELRYRHSYLIRGLERLPVRLHR